MTYRRHRGATIVVVALLLLVIVVVAGAGVYLLYFSAAPGQKTSGTGTSVSSGGTRTTTQTGAGQSYKTYSGTYSYSVPLGPSGERVDANNTVETYTSVQEASGTFVFFINPANHTGVGTGQGTLTVTTTGFCSGKTTLEYNFKIVNANDLLDGNITVGFGTPSPGTFTVPLTCTGSLVGVNTATNNPLSFLSVYPNLVSVRSIPASVSQTLSGNIEYRFTITPTN